VDNISDGNGLPVIAFTIERHNCGSSVDGTISVDVDGYGIISVDVDAGENGIISVDDVDVDGD